MNNETTNETQRSMEEISSDIKQAGEAPEAQESPDKTGDEIRPANPSDEQQDSPVDGQVVTPVEKPAEPPEPTAKTPEEMSMDPKDVLQENVDKDMVEEMKAADIPDGNANENPPTPRTMDDVIKDIKGA